MRHLRFIFALLLTISSGHAFAAETPGVEKLHHDAEQGLAEAQYNLGLMYYKSVPRDSTEAIKWFRKAADQGHVVAQTLLGAAYNQGEGVPRDYTESENWYRKAADQGHAEAQSTLGLIYHKGIGVPRDDTESADWYRKAAEQELVQAQFNLGLMYSKGQGVQSDSTEAVKWYRKAADRQTTVLSEISAGLAFWTSRANSPRPLTFMLDNRGPRSTSCEPITRGFNDFFERGKWIADVLTAQGYPATPRNHHRVARAFVNDRRRALGADWGILILVVDSLNDSDGSFADGRSAAADLNGPMQYLTYDNGGWGISRMHLVSLHETGHNFGALDEYADSGCSTSDSWGYLNVANASCNNGGITSDLSVMGEGFELDNPSADISISAREAIGWRNPVGKVVDVVRTASVSLTPFLPDPTTDKTPTYSASAANFPFPPGGCNTLDGICSRTPVPVMVSQVQNAQWRLDGGSFISEGVIPRDGAFDEQTEEAYTFTPVFPVSIGAHTFWTRSINNFGHISNAKSDTLTILNVTGPVLRITDVSKAEGNAGTTVFTFTVTMSLASTSTVTVNYATANGSALAGSDYTPRSGTLTFAPGQTSKTVPVNVVGNTVREPNETFFLNLSVPSGATIADGQGSGTILNDDGPLLSINNVTATEGNVGSKNFVFTVTLSPAATSTVTVRCVTANWTATAPSDYTAVNTLLTFTPGQRSKTCSVPVIGNTVREANEAFVVNLVSPVGATIVDPDFRGSGTILNDDGPLLSINNVTVTEGNVGSKNFVFTVTLSPAATSTVTVRCVTANWTATAPSDYTAVNTLLTFTPGQRSKTCSVPVIGNTVREANEAFVVNLVSPVGATIVDPDFRGSGTILNDDGPLLSINNVTATEGNVGSKNFVFTVTLSPAATSTVTVRCVTANWTATAPSDYTAVNTLLTFTPGQRSKTCSVPVIGNTVREANEAFVVNLVSPVGATIVDPDFRGSGTILNDDGPLLIPLEAGRVSGVTGQWTSVSVPQAFTTPIVTAGPLSSADVQPAGVRVRNVSGSGFQVRAQEWDSQDGVHGAEQLSYVVMERGRYLLGNGKGVLADSTSVGGGGFQSKVFSQPFPTIPLILATVVTQNEAEAVTVQIRNVTTTGFQIRLWEQEANSQAHAAETVHYLAWEPGVGTLNGFAFEVGTIGVNNVFTTLWVGSPFADVPLLISGSQTTVGTEAYSIRHRNITRARVEMSLQEDDSFDAESSHATETVGYLMLGTPGPPGVGRDATLVAMGDSITFGIGDDITTDNYPVGILPPGGYPPILTRRVNDQLGKDILISNEGIPGDRSADGAGDVANLVGAYAQAQSFLLLYGANDAGFNVRSGVGLSPGQSGYLGSFKGNMQQLITSLLHAGKTPILAKVLYQTNPSKDPLIQQYNQVIEELASQNNLHTIPRPDFYTFFKNNPSLLPDGLHPNGTGYQSMATLWYDAISGLLQ